MQTKNLGPWQHDHTFEQDRKRAGENKTLLVIGITATMMVVEIVTGVLSGSLALLADGLHMASHTVALGISFFAYIYARRHAADGRFSFGTGKVNSLGGFAGAVLLGGFAIIMVWESLARMFVPVAIVFDQAIFVAVIGLVVNGASFFILQGPDSPHGDHDHDHDHDHPHQDHNLRAACLHVLADALTSLLAIFALLSAKYFGVLWMDPLMGIVGAVLVSRWSLGLLKTTSKILLDHQAEETVQTQVRAAIEADRDSRVVDLHVWAIGPNLFSAIISVTARQPKSPKDYKEALPKTLGLAHVSVEVYQSVES